MTPDSRILRGVPYGEACCFGMPHVGSRYRNANANSNRLLERAECAACGAPATNSHHEPPKGAGGRNRGFLLGGRILRPALIALCGSGTTGCHGLRHSGRLRFRWVWDDEEAEAEWWAGTLGVEPHSDALYDFGHWEVSRDGGPFEFLMG